MIELRGEQPHMQFVNDPWGHDEKCVGECDCLVSDRTGAFVHCLIPPLDQTSLIIGLSKVIASPYNPDWGRIPSDP